MKNRQFLFLLAAGLIAALPVRATTIHTIVRENATLAPGQKITVEIDTDEALDVGWEAKQDPACTEDCIRFSAGAEDDEAGGFSSSSNGYSEYRPVDGKITVTYANIGKQDVTIDVWSEKHICDSDACALLKEKNVSYPFEYGKVKSDFRRLVLGKINTIEDSKDGSYSHITGQTINGKDFDVTAIWWTFDAPTWGGSCRKWVEQFGNYTEGEDKAYAISGSFLEEPVTNIFTDIGCSKTDAHETRPNDL